MAWIPPKDLFPEGATVQEEKWTPPKDLFPEGAKKSAAIEWTPPVDLFPGDTLLRETQKGITAFAKRTGVHFTSIATESVDFLAGLIARHAPTIVKPKISKLVKIPGVKEKKDQWIDFVNKHWEKSPTRKLKRAADKLEELEFMQPPKGWQEAPLKEKFTTRLPETVFEIGPSVVASIGLIALTGPTVGMTALSASVAGDVRDEAIAHGVSSERADLLATSTGVLTAALERIVPARIFGGALKIKNRFTGGFARRLMTATGLETVTELTQEQVQMAAQSTFREVGFDEAATRSSMAMLGGVMGGAGMQSLATFVNSVQRKDVPPLETLPPEELAPEVAPVEPARAVAPAPAVAREVAPEVRPEPAIPKELEPLAREARKYKMAEEEFARKNIKRGQFLGVNRDIPEIRKISEGKKLKEGTYRIGKVKDIITNDRILEQLHSKTKEIEVVLINSDDVSINNAGRFIGAQEQKVFPVEDVTGKKIKTLPFTVTNKDAPVIAINAQRSDIFGETLIHEIFHAERHISKRPIDKIAERGADRATEYFRKHILKDFHAQATKAPEPSPAVAPEAPIFKAGQTTEQKLIEFNKLIRGEGWTAVPSSPQMRQFIRNLPENIRKREAIKVFEQVERALRQKTLTLGQIQKSIREATGQVPSPFIRKREYTLLKDRLRNIARGAKEAATFTRKEIRAVQTELLDILDHSRINPVDKVKFRRTIKNVQTREQLNKMLPDFKKKVIDLIEKRERRVLKYAIKKELRKITPEKDKPGRTSVVYEFLRGGLKQKYFEHGRLRTQAQNETLLEELQTKIEGYDISNPVHREDFVLHALLSEDTKGFDEMSAGELDAVLTRIKQTRRIARDSFLWKQLERAVDLTEKIEGSIENMRGKGLRPQTPTNKRRLRNRLMQFVSTVDIFDRGFLQIVNLLDSIRGGRFFRDALYQPIMEGNRDYFVQDNKFMEADKKFFEKVFNKKGLLLDRQISNLKKQQNLGMVKDAKGTEHNLWFSNSEMIDIYLYGQTKPTLKAMKEQGIYVGGDNPKTRVFYMTNEVLQKIEGKMSREAELIVEHIKKNIQDNEFIKAMVTAYEAKYNKPFPFVKEAYWTMVRRYMGRQQKGHDVFNPEYSQDAIISPSSFKLRVKNNNPLVVSDGWGKFVRWRRDIQKFISYDKALVDAKAVIGNPDFKSEFIEKYGYKSYRHLMDGFNVVATGGKRYDDMLAHSANYIRQLLSINFVGGRPVRSLAGQTSSFVAAIAEVPAKNFAKSIEEFIANPGKAYNMMMRSPIIALRHKRADFTRGLLEQETKQFRRYGVSPARMAMFFVKTGDMGGVLGAGYAVYDYNFTQYRKGRMSKAKADQLAMQDMEVFVVSTQQSALPELRNWIMQQHPIIRTAGAFQQTQAQYRAKGFEAMNTWLNSENKWSKENFGRMFKRVATYHFTLPALFELSRGNINPISMASRVIFTPISGFMGHGQVAEWAIKLAIFSTLVPLLALDEDKWEKILPFNPTTLIGESKRIFERTFKSARDMLSQKEDQRDILRLIDSTLLMLKVPAKNIREEYIKFHDILTGADNSFLRILETEWQAEQRRKEQEKKEQPRKRKGLDALLEDILK